MIELIVRELIFTQPVGVFSTLIVPHGLSSILQGLGSTPEENCTELHPYQATTFQIRDLSHVLISLGRLLCRELVPPGTTLGDSSLQVD